MAGSPSHTQRDSDVQVSFGSRRSENEIVSPSPAAEVPGPEQVSESETENVPGFDRRTRRRLSLVWRPNIPDSVPVQNQADAPDSHDQRVFRVRRAMQMERQEARSRPELHVPGPHPPCIRRGWEAMDTINCRPSSAAGSGVPKWQMRAELDDVLMTCNLFEKEVIVRVLSKLNTDVQPGNTLR